MRLLNIIIFLFCFSFTAFAQMDIVPLEANPVLKKEFQFIEKEKKEAYVRLGGVESFVSRDLNCENFDGSFDNGEIIYLTAGDSVSVCFETDGFDVTHLTANLSFGTANYNDSTSCINYFANAGVTIGTTDTIRIEFCDTIGCFELFNPIVVKRANDTIVEPLITLNQEEIVSACVSSLNLPGNIYSTTIIDCSFDLKGSYYNGNYQDDCFVYEASRFGEIDEICFEICDDLCVCDTYIFTFQANSIFSSYPFMDDFSYDGPYPTKSKWLDDNVFVNSTMGFQPPSVGVASFDGLDETGTPRGGGTGRSDFLTSSYFNLSSSDTDLWLSFWLENKGFSYPSNPGDSMIIEFKNDLGDWVSVGTIDGANYINADRPPFEFYKFPVEDDGDVFLHNNFQFRFVNRGNRNSIQDTWHLDYVILDQGEPDGYFDDLAFSTKPTYILENYTSMPFWQFENFETSELSDSIFYVITNHFDVPVLVTDSEVFHEETNTNTILNGNHTVELSPSNILPDTSVAEFRTVPSSAFSDLGDDLVNSFANSTDVLVERTYTLVSGVSQSGTFTDVLRNDTVRSTTVFQNYFAYDDGTAEAAAGLTNEGWDVAVRFHANVADTIRGVQFHFPHYNPTNANKFFNLKIWIGELDDEPEFERELLKPFYPDAFFDSLQAFTTYVLDDFSGNVTTLPIPAGDFYVGWEYASGAPTYVGLDYNSPEVVGKQFISNNISWFPLTDPGALMIRPVLGSTQPHPTGLNEKPFAENFVKVFPNPASDMLNFEIKDGVFQDYTVSIFNAVGQKINELPLNQQLDVSVLNSGVYLLNISNNETKESQIVKVVIQN